jgi:hypothetical protein
MERAEARRLQPHFIQTFFIEAFRHLGGRIVRRETGRWEISRVPGPIRERDRQIGIGEAVLDRYERVCFEKDKINEPPVAAFLCPGHPLLDATIDLILERYRDLMKQGAVLVNDADGGEETKVLFYLEHSVQDGRIGKAGLQQVISRRLQFVEIYADGRTIDAGPAPYLDYRPITDEERSAVGEHLKADWLVGDIESQIMGYAIEHIIPRHVEEVRIRKLPEIEKIKVEVTARLKKEINYWDHRAQDLKAQEEAGRKTKLSSDNAQRRANNLAERQQRRLDELKKERDISALPPNIRGGAIVVPAGLLAETETAEVTPTVPPNADSRREVEILAMDAVTAAEKALGFEPRDVSADRVGYDIESRDPESGDLRFIEVKGRVEGADTVTVTRNEILTALNKPDAFIFAVVLVNAGVASEPRYVRQPFQKEPDFGATSVTYKLTDLLEKSERPQKE